MHQVFVGYPTMHKALVFLYVYNGTLCSDSLSTKDVVILRSLERHAIE